MILDSSAIIAILAREPECEQLVDQLLAARSKAVSAATLLETAKILRRPISFVQKGSCDGEAGERG